MRQPHNRLCLRSTSLISLQNGGGGSLLRRMSSVRKDSLSPPRGISRGIRYRCIVSRSGRRVCHGGIADACDTSPYQRPLIVHGRWCRVISRRWCRCIIKQVGRMLSSGRNRPWSPARCKSQFAHNKLLLPPRHSIGVPPEPVAIAANNVIKNASRFIDIPLCEKSKIL